MSGSGVRMRGGGQEPVLGWVGGALMLGCGRWGQGMGGGFHDNMYVTPQDAWPCSFAQPKSSPRRSNFWLKGLVPDFDQALLLFLADAL